MTTKEVARILLYHNKGGFREDLKGLYGRIADMREANSEMQALSFKLALPKNRNNSSTVEIYVMRNSTILDFEVEAREMERFIGRLDYAVANLPDKEKQVITARYFNRSNTALDFVHVAAAVNYGTEWCEKLNKRALEMLVQELQGVQVTWGAND